MKGRLLSVCIVCLVVLLLVPTSGSAQERSNAVVLKGGAFFPTDDLDDNEFDSGFNGEVAYEHRFNPNFALAAGLGLYHTESDVSDPGFDMDTKLTVVPMTVTAKGIIPTGAVEFYGGGGLGLYFASVESDVRLFGYSFDLEDQDAVLGAHLLAGLTIPVSEIVFLGVEGRYIWTDDAEFEDSDVSGPYIVFLDGETNLNGFALAFNVGFRF
jgi:opacity protein-like surface antigen